MHLLFFFLKAQKYSFQPLRAEKYNESDRKAIDLLYKSFSNYTGNRTKSDSTFDKAVELCK